MDPIDPKLKTTFDFLAIVPEIFSGDVAAKLSKEILAELSKGIKRKRDETVQTVARNETIGEITDEITRQLIDETASRVINETASRVPDEIASRVPDETASRVPDEIASRVPDETTSRIPDEYEKAMREMNNNIYEECFNNIKRIMTMTKKPPYSIEYFRIQIDAEKLYNGIMAHVLLYGKVVDNNYCKREDNTSKIGKNNFIKLQQLIYNDFGFIVIDQSRIQNSSSNITILLSASLTFTISALRVQLWHHLNKIFIKVDEKEQQERIDAFKEYLKLDMSLEDNPMNMSNNDKELLKACDMFYQDLSRQAREACEKILNSGIHNERLKYVPLKLDPTKEYSPSPCFTIMLHELLYGKIYKSRGKTWKFNYLHRHNMISNRLGIEEPYKRCRREIAKEYGYMLLDSSPNPNGYDEAKKKGEEFIVSRWTFLDINIAVWRVTPYADMSDVPELWHKLNKSTKEETPFVEMSKVRYKRESAADLYMLRKLREEEEHNSKRQRC